VDPRLRGDDPRLRGSKKSAPVTEVSAARRAGEETFVVALDCCRSAVVVDRESTPNSLLR
jgi:hypothetical protein